MITSFKQAQAVQTRRFKKGLRGISKAVRRWYKRTQPVPSPAIGGLRFDNVNFEGCGPFVPPPELKR